MFLLSIVMVLGGVFTVLVARLSAANSGYAISRRHVYASVAFAFIGNIVAIIGLAIFNLVLKDTADTSEARGLLFISGLVAIIMTATAWQESFAQFKTHLLRFLQWMTVAAGLGGSLFFVSACGTLLVAAR